MPTPNPFGGYQPDTKAPSSRRADFDLLRRLRALELTGGGGGGGTDEVWVGTAMPTNPALELWYDPDAPSVDSGSGMTFVQGVASAVWTINHTLSFQPNVTVVDSAGTQVEGSITYTDGDTVTVTFSAAFAGKAYLS